MGAIIIVYSICFVSLVLAAVLYLRRCTFAERIKTTQAFSVQFQHNETDNNIVLKNNFTEIYLNIPNEQKNNFPLLVLKQLCTDIEEGKNYSGGWYLSLYKKYHVKFVTILFLSSFAVPLIALFIAALAREIEYIAVPLIAFHSVLFLLMGALCVILVRNFYSFTEIFYKHWYEKLLNFNAMRFSALKTKLTEEAELRSILSEIKTTYTSHSEALAKSSSELASQIQRLADEKQKGNIVSIESITGAFEANTNRVQTLCANLEASAKTLEISFSSLIEFTGKNENSINATNKLANEFAGLKNTILKHTSASENAAINKLEGISEVLKTDIHRTWTDMDEILNKNANDLSTSYEHFFELFKSVSDAAKKRDAKK